MSEPITLLVGAGTGSLQWLKRFRDSNNEYLILDNDPKKWGKTHGGVSIVGPHQVDPRSISRAIICFAHIRQAREQLASLGIDGNKIFVPPKADVTEALFGTTAAQKHGLSFLYSIVELFAALQCDVVAEYGTALGLVRDFALIPWDNDIDTSICATNSRAIRVVAQASVLPKPIERSRLIGAGSSQSLIISSTDGVEASVTVRWEQDGMLYQGSRGGFSYAVPTWMLFPAQPWEVRGRRFLVPRMAQDYLNLIYGEDWRTPNCEVSYEELDCRMNLNPR